MKSKIVKFLVEKDKLTEELKEWVKDKSISLDERWEVFIESDLGIHKSFIERFKTLDNDLIGTDCAISVYKYETIFVESIYEAIQEAQEELEENPDSVYVSKKLANTDLNSFREECLEKFIKSFEFNW